MTSLAPQIITSYKTYLKVKYPSHLNKYCERLLNSQEGARAEALLFSILRHEFKDVKISENLSSGGADFLCIAENGEFLFEVTSLEAEAVAKQSSWPNEITKEAHSFSMITKVLRTKVSGKVPQLAGKPVPRVLAITSEHIGSGFLLGTRGAETLLKSDTEISVPIGKPIENTTLVTNLKESVFFKWENQVIESCRRSISAILLISISTNKCYIVGMLHYSGPHISNR